MSRPPELDRNQDATCYIGNIDDRATDAVVWELMIQAGPLVNLHLPKDRITQSHQGYAFAEFQTEQDADYACKVMNGLKLYGKPIRVNKASNDRKQIDIGANLFVGSLDPAVDERLLYETFSTFGGIIGLPKVARDPASGEPKGYAFVSFDSFEAADAAIEALNGQFLLNKNITVDYAMKKDSKNGERHGTAAERLLAAQARKNNALPTHQYPQQLGQPPRPMAPPYGQPPAAAPLPPNGNSHQLHSGWGAYTQQSQQISSAYPSGAQQPPVHAAAYPQNPPPIHMNPGAPPAYPHYQQ
ncbi:related to spliceosome-associated protein SAP-49 [Ustilago trichophora]|uniref:Related to spliceosome-associated protein SAP-49 n=1 Tax=Ustilago trichophora TaxID=86804 RepID=A0A5C3EMY0_9BASI|nr:related to spliceosome-associated protein SAP-49 [Ustilago trichophora]